MSCDPGCFNGICFVLGGVLSLTQTPCPSGFACIGGRDSGTGFCPLPTLCSEGTFALPFSSSCLPCPLGSLTPKGSSFCGPPCPAGTWSDGWTSCALCPAGTANSFAGASSKSSCEPCKDGVSMSPGSAVCILCPSGTISSSDHTSCLNISLSPTTSPSSTSTSSVLPSFLVTTSSSPSSSPTSGINAAATASPLSFATLGASAGVSFAISLFVAAAWHFVVSKLNASIFKSQKYSSVLNVNSEFLVSDGIFSERKE